MGKDISVTKKTEFMAREVLEVLSVTGASLTEACKAVSMNKASFYRWLEASPKNEEMYFKAMQRLCYDVIGSVYKKACDGDIPAAKYWLNNIMPKRFQDRVVGEISGTIEHKDRIFDMKALVGNDVVEAEIVEEDVLEDEDEML